MFFFQCLEKLVEVLFQITYFYSEITFCRNYFANRKSEKLETPSTTNYYYQFYKQTFGKHVLNKKNCKKKGKTVFQVFLEITGKKTFSKNVCKRLPGCPRPTWCSCQTLESSSAFKTIFSFARARRSGFRAFSRLFWNFL